MPEADAISRDVPIGDIVDSYRHIARNQYQKTQAVCPPRLLRHRSERPCDTRAGKRNELAPPRRNRDLLAPVCGWFIEGFDTRDLKKAKALLDDFFSSSVTKRDGAARYTV
jgi:hypothetical protein